MNEAQLNFDPWKTHHSMQPHAFLRLVVTDTHGNYAVTRAYTSQELMDN